MYIYKSSLVKYKNRPTGWENINISNMKVGDIVRDFKDVYFTFENTILSGFHYCFLNDLLTVSINMDRTLNQALSDIDNIALPTTTTAKTLISKSATYADALQAGWSFITSRPGSPPDSESIGSLRTDVYLSKPGVSSVEAGKSLVCLINGMAHWTFAAYNGIVALGGGRTMKRTDSNLINFLNLGHLGEISYKGISGNDMKPGTHSMLSETFDVYLELGEDLTNKSLILSLGGLLYFEGNVVTVINREKGHVKLNWHRIEHGSMFYEIETCLKPVELGDIMDNIRAGILTKSSVYDPDNLKAILDMPQTFAIIVDAPNVVCEHKAVNDGNLKNVLYSDIQPNKPIRAFSPRLLPYRVKEESGKFALHVDSYVTPAFVHWTVRDFNVYDYICYGTMRSVADLHSAAVYVDIKTEWFE